MPPTRTWLPREGFTIDVISRIIRSTAFNPTLTLPLFLLAHYTDRGQQLASDHETALRGLKLLLYIGIAQLLNNFLSRSVQNNWTSSKYNWDKEIAVITGGSNGIGKHIALLLVEKGVKVASLDIQQPTYEPNPNISHYTCDIASASSVRETAEAIRSTLGDPTLLVNNAGYCAGLPILSSTDEINGRTFAVNTLSHFRLVREFVPAMVTANHGTIVTIASISASVSTPSIVDYSSSKSAALSFHEGLAAELKTLYKAPKIRTVCVCPSWVETNMTSLVKIRDKFVMPMLKVETLAERVVQQILSGNSGVVVVTPDNGKKRTNACLLPLSTFQETPSAPMAASLGTNADVITLKVPEVANWVAWPARALPMWLQVNLRNGAGRQVEGLTSLEKVIAALHPSTK
ncbi:MAG: hypothetical protein Q9195_002750 [Heterodermia aff. obscurata]